MGTLFLRLLIQTGPSFYVVIRPRRRSRRLQWLKGSTRTRDRPLCSQARESSALPTELILPRGKHTNSNSSEFSTYISITSSVEWKRIENFINVLEPYSLGTTPFQIGDTKNCVIDRFIYLHCLKCVPMKLTSAMTCEREIFKLFQVTKCKGFNSFKLKKNNKEKNLKKAEYFYRQDFRITPYINYAYIHCLKKTKDGIIVARVRMASEAPSTRRRL